MPNNQIKFAVEVTREPWHYVLRVPVGYPKRRLLKFVRRIAKDSCRPRTFALMQFAVASNSQNFSSTREMMLAWNKWVGKKELKFPDNPVGVSQFSLYIRRAKQRLRELGIEAQLKRLSLENTTAVTCDDGKQRVEEKGGSP